MVAALPAVCDHCGETTTLGAMAEHRRACQQRPTTCTAATAGCGWEGMAAGHAAHEKTCPLAQNALLQQQVAANLLEMFFSNEIT